MFYLKHQQVDNLDQTYCRPLPTRTQYEDNHLSLGLLSPQCSTLEHTQSQNDCPVPSRHKQSCTFRSFSVQRGTYRLCDKGHMRNVTQTSAPQLDLPDLCDLHWPLQKVKQHREQILDRHKPWHWLTGFGTQRLRKSTGGRNSRNTNYDLMYHYSASTPLISLHCF